MDTITFAPGGDHLPSLTAGAIVTFEVMKPSSPQSFRLAIDYKDVFILNSVVVVACFEGIINP